MIRKKEHVAVLMADSVAVTAGATLVEDVVNTSDGDELAMLRDPWGQAIQLCKRSRLL